LQHKGSDRSRPFRHERRPHMRILEAALSVVVVIIAQVLVAGAAFIPA
jgi:hypothetical protein